MLPFWSPAFGGQECPPHMIKVEDDVLTHAADGRDAAVFEGRGNCRRGRFQGLFFLAQPDRFDDVSGDSFGEAACNGFDLGEFGHGIDLLTSTKMTPRARTCAVPPGLVPGFDTPASFPLR